jgi:kynurenine formamidase
MCAPALIDAVRTDLSRRRVLRTLGGAAIAGAVSPRGAAAAAPPARQPVVRLPRGFTTVHDLTHTLSADTPVVPDFRRPAYDQKFTIARNGYQCGELTYNEHSGTHMDAPVHFFEGQTTVDRLPVDRFLAPLVVVSIKDRVDRDPDASVSVDDLLAWERQHGRIPAGALVAMHAGWDSRYADRAAFLNADARGTSHTPGFSGDASTFLVEQREIVGIGVDTLSLDPGASGKAASHLAILGAGKYGVEVIANLGTIPPAGATIVVGAPKHLNGTGGPVRLYALV